MVFFLSYMCEHWKKTRREMPVAVDAEKAHNAENLILFPLQEWYKVFVRTRWYLAPCSQVSFSCIIYFESAVKKSPKRETVSQHRTFSELIEFENSKLKSSLWQWRTRPTANSEAEHQNETSILVKMNGGERYSDNVPHTFHDDTEKIWKCRQI